MSSTFSPESIKTLRYIAASLHKQNVLATAIEIDQEFIGQFDEMTDLGVLKSETGIQFETLEIRNQFAAEYYYDNNKELLLNGNNWLNVCLNLFRTELDASDYVCGRLLALLADDMDLLSEASLAIKQHNVFDVLTAIGLALPYLKTVTASSIVKLAEAQEAFTRNDMAYGEFFRKLSDALKRQPDIARELLDCLRTSIDQSNASLYLTATTSLRTCDDPNHLAVVILNDSRSANKTLVSVSIQMMGNLIGDQRLGLNEKNALAESIRRNFRNDDEQLRNASLNAVLNSSSSTCEFDDEIKALIKEGSSDASYLFAKMLFLSDQAKERLGDLLPVMARNHAISKTNPTFLDYLIEKLIDSLEFRDQCIAALEQWILSAKEADSVPADFPQSSNKILLNSTLFSSLTQQWLLHSSFHVRCAVDDLLTKRFECPPLLTFDPNEVGSLQLSDFQLLAYRCVGYLTVGATTVSLVASLLRSEILDANRISLICQLMLDELGQSYPGFVISELEKLLSCTQNAALKQACLDVVRTLQEEHAARKRLPPRKEFQPLLSVVTAFADLQKRKFNDAFKKSESKSALLKLVTRVPIKAGAKVIYFGKTLQDCRMGSTLNEIQVDITVPRLLHIDPIGYEMQRFAFRRLERPQ